MPGLVASEWLKYWVLAKITSIIGLKKAQEVTIITLPSKIFELDELFWFIRKKSNTKTRENVYLMLMISQKPRQIAARCDCDKRAEEEIQRMV
jgi:hypothetical protein